MIQININNKYQIIKIPSDLKKDKKFSKEIKDIITNFDINLN